MCQGSVSPPGVSQTPTIKLGRGLREQTLLTVNLPDRVADTQLLDGHLDVGDRVSQTHR